MFNGRLGSSGFVGIDIGARNIKMLQLRERHGELKVVGAARFDAPAQDATPDQITARWQHALSSGGFTGRSCVVSIPREIMHVQAVRLPSMDDNELREAARWEAAQRFNLEHDGLVADYIRTGATLQGKEIREEVLLFAAEAEAVRRIVQPIIDVGLRPIAIDVSAAALGRTFSRRARREKDQQDTRAVLEVGYGGSTVLILKGNQIAMCKAIELGGQQFDRAVAEHLQVDVDSAADLRKTRLRHAASSHDGEDDAMTVDQSTERAVFEAIRPLMGNLARELTMCMRYYGVTFRGAAPKHVLLAGGESTEPRLGEVIAEACNVTVLDDDEIHTLASLLAEVRAKLGKAAGSPGDWAVAVGLSMRAMQCKVAPKHSRRAAA